MAANRTLIEQAYSAFNRRGIDGALALMTENVSWPKASEGGRAFGKEVIRAYWTRQWGEFDGHVEPLEINEGGRRQGSRQGPSTRQEPSRRGPMRRRSSSRIQGELRSYRSHGP
jgi:hypothetical protein